MPGRRPHAPTFLALIERHLGIPPASAAPATGDGSVSGTARRAGRLAHGAASWLSTRPRRATVASGAKGRRGGFTLIALMKDRWIRYAELGVAGHQLDFVLSS